MRKKIFSVMICIFLALNIFCTVSFAAEISDVKVNLPEVTAEICAPSGTGASLDESAIKATLGGSELSCNGITLSDPSIEWIVFVDATASVSRTHFESQKAAIMSIYDSLSKEDSLTVYAFAEKTTQILDGSETKEQAESKINAMNCNGQETVFYDAMSELADLASKSDKDKCIPIIFTDGVDTISKTDASTVKEKVEKTGVPFYGLYPDNIKAEDAKAFNELLSVSGGQAVAFTTNDVTDKLPVAGSDDEVFYVNFTAPEGIESNDAAEFSLDLGDGKPITKTVKVTSNAAESTEASSTETEQTTKAVVPQTPDGKSDNGLLKIIIPAAAGLIVLILIIVIAKSKKKKPEENNNVKYVTPINPNGNDSADTEGNGSDSVVPAVKPVPNFTDQDKKSRKSENKENSKEKDKDKDKDKQQFQFYFEGKK